jgi:hypothetical protein
MLLIFARGINFGFELIEEGVKLALVVYMVRETRGEGGGKLPWYYGAMIGTLFGITEVMLYVMNAMSVGVYEGLLLRAVTTVPMHAAGPTIMLVMGQRMGKLGWLMGFALAVLLHLSFNLLVG